MTVDTRTPVPADLRSDLRRLTDLGMSETTLIADFLGDVADEDNTVEMLTACLDEMADVIRVIRTKIRQHTATATSDQADHTPIGAVYADALERIDDDEDIDELVRTDPTFPSSEHRDAVLALRTVRDWCYGA